MDSLRDSSRDTQRSRAVIHGHAAVINLGLLSLGLILILLTSPAKAQEASSARELARNVGCLTCHGVESRSNDDEVGPPFGAISEKNQDDQTARERLMKSISLGSKGGWGPTTRGVPMPPYSARLTKDEIVRLTDWIMSLPAATR